MRFALTALLWLFTTVALAVAVPTVVGADPRRRRQRLHGNGAQSGRRQALQAAVAAELATRATVLINQQRLRVDSAQVHGVAAGYTAGPDFPAQFADANRLAHDWMFTGAHAQSEGDQWVVDLAGMLKDSAFEKLLASYDVQGARHGPGPGDGVDAKGVAAGRVTAAGRPGVCG